MTAKPAASATWTWTQAERPDTVCDDGVIVITSGVGVAALEPVHTRITSTATTPIQIRPKQDPLARRTTGSNHSRAAEHLPGFAGSPQPDDGAGRTCGDDLLAGANDVDGDLPSRDHAIGLGPLVRVAVELHAQVAE